MKLKINHIILSIFLIVFFTSCLSVDLPENRTVKNNTSTNIKDKLPKYPKDKITYQEVANKKITNVKEGDKNLYDIEITKELKTAYDGYIEADGDKALKALNTISKTSKDDMMLWQASFFKNPNFNHDGSWR